MLAGVKEEFAIELDVLDVADADDWVFGTFLFWIKGNCVGDPEDVSVHLRGCINWLADFVDEKGCRVEPELYRMEKGRAFAILCRPLAFFSPMAAPEEMAARFGSDEDIFARFHFSHLGMSSFDRVILLLVENIEGKQRCIWQQGEEEVKDAYLDAGEIERVALEAIHRFSAISDKEAIRKGAR